MALEDYVPSGNLFTGLDPRANLALRQRIALQMMANAGKGKGYPKNLGEGLTAVGDALGEIGLARRLASEDVAAQQGAKSSEDTLPVEAPATRSEAEPEAPVKTTAEEPAPADATPPAVVAPSPGDNPIVRTNPDGTLSGNITAPAELPPVPPGVTPASPAAATTPPINPVVRQRVAQLLAAQGGPQPNPILAGQVPASLRLSTPAPGATPPGGPEPDQRLAYAGPDSDMPLPPQIRQAPPQNQIRVAQAPTVATSAMTPQQQYRQPVPAPNFQYVMPGVNRPVPPPQTPQSPREKAAQDAISNNLGNPYVAQRMQPILAEEQAKRQFIDAQNKAQYDKDLEAYLTLGTKRQDQIAGQAQRGVEGETAIEGLRKAAAENALRAQFGNLPPDEVIKTLTGSKAIAKTAQQAIVGLQNAKDAFDRGIVGGYGADARLTLNKMLGLLGKKSSGNIAADTEVFKAAMQPIVASILHQTSGMSQLSEGELAFARQAAAGNISLEPGAIHHLLRILDKANRAIISDHSNMVNTMFPPEQKQPHAMFDVPMPPELKTTTPNGRLYVSPNTRTIVSTPEEARQLPRGTRFEFIGPNGQIMHGTVP